MDSLPITISPHHYALFGLAIVTLVMLRLTIQRFRKNREKQREMQNAIEAAQKAERKRQQETLIPKSKVYSPKTRLPLGDPFSAPFTGNIQGIAAKWEAEIHQIGRQIIGQIDSKMSALQAITLEANRTANRLDILVEHLETLARQQIEREQRARIQTESAEHGAAENFSNVIPSAESGSASAPLVDMLKELADDLEGVHHAIEHSTTFEDPPEQAVILRLPEIQAKNFRSEVEMLSNYGLDSQEIARQLNISQGEVDLILQMQQNRE